MEYFKHYTNARHSESLATLLNDHGFEMYGRYWRLLEFLGETFDGEATSFRYHRRDMRDLFRVHSWDKLRMIAERLSNVRGISVIEDRMIYKVDAPILLDLMSRDFKRARNERAETAPKIKSKIKIEDKEVEVEPPADLRDLNALFKGKIGEATYKLISSQTKRVWLELYGSDLNFICRAFISALAKWQARLPKDQGAPDTFFTTQLKYDWPHHQKHKEKSTKPKQVSGFDLEGEEA